MPIGPAIAPALAVRFTPQRAENDDRRMRCITISPQLPADFESVNVWKHQVENHRLRYMSPGFGNCGMAVVRMLVMHSANFRVSTDQRADLLIIFHNKH